MNSEEIKMNKKPKKASAWKGDILIQAFCEKRATLTPECLAVIDQVYQDVAGDVKPYQNSSVES